MNYVSEICSKVNVYEQFYCFYLGNRAYPAIDLDKDNIGIFILFIIFILFLIFLEEFSKSKLGKKFEEWGDKKEKEIEEYRKNMKKDDDWF